MGGFREVGIKHSYAGKGERILHEFLLPLMSVATEYDRITSFYTIDSLLAISQGVQSLYENRGHMRLIIGVHSFPSDLVDASLRRTHLQNQIKQVRESIESGLETIEDSLVRKRLATLAWMIQDGLLEAKAVAVAGDHGIFHAKTLILGDASGDRIAAVGSPNETASGLGDNFEQIMVQKSWETSDGVDEQIEFFESLWNGTNKDAVVQSISEELEQSLSKHLESHGKQPVSTGQCSSGLLSVAAKMPSNFFVSGEVPALYHHQERAVIDALSRWPVRVLFGDEVGLGKTFEAASAIAFLVKYGGVKRVLILTPKSVLLQWQDELSTHFGMKAWVYDSAKQAYVNPGGQERPARGANPIGKQAPNLLLMSAQFARGGGRKKSIFESGDPVLPDLLVLDEAHSARVSRDISGKKKTTRMYRAIAAVADKIPHIIFATATPMQRDAEEYHAMLKLLGLPKPWKNAHKFDTSLKLIANDQLPDFSDAATAGKLLLSTIETMKPEVDGLSDDEISLIDELASYKDADDYSMAEFVEQHWNIFRVVLIKLHPARLLTVRDTRKSLEEVGYCFPIRKLHEIPIEDSDAIQVFYMKVNDYIENNYFSIERVLYPDRKFNTGFVRTSYRQRVSSSLYSCRKSLGRRLEKVLSLRKYLEAHSDINSVFDVYDFDIDDFDSFDEDELFEQGKELVESASEKSPVNVRELWEAVEREVTALPPLLSDADELLATCGDMKIETSIELAFKCVRDGDQVLLFSRYTDTINALLEEFKCVCGQNAFEYGVYIGSKAAITVDGVEQLCTKEDIKDELNSRRLKIMFCSDAASEGLNLQAARVLINVDVPWTPARLEQRIGRIARLGQTAKSVDVYNVWYPNSIEARMYRRIQMRLKDADIAVGEFPEVVAESIKKAVLENSDNDDNSAQMLQEIRNSEQARALSELWSAADSTRTASAAVRKQLMGLCEENFECTGTELDGEVRIFNLPDGEVKLSAREGLDESISLTSRPWKFVDYPLGDLDFLSDEMGNPSTFVRQGDLSSWLSSEWIYDLAHGKLYDKNALTGDYPNTLPDPGKLDMRFALGEDAVCPNEPKFWPPRMEEK